MQCEGGCDQAVNSRYQHWSTSDADYWCPPLAFQREKHVSGVLDPNITFITMGVEDKITVSQPKDGVTRTGERIYVAGPMRGYEKSNFPAFDVARDKLLALGHEVVSPADLDRARGITEDDEDAVGATFAEAMRIDTVALLCCTGVFFIKGWKPSVGAKYENAVSNKLNISIDFDDDAEPGEVVISVA